MRLHAIQAQTTAPSKRVGLRALPILALLVVLALNMTAQITPAGGAPSSTPTIVPLVLTYWGWLPSVQTVPPGPVIFQITNQTMLQSMSFTIQGLSSNGASSSGPPNIVLAEHPASALGTTLHNAMLTSSGSYSVTISEYPSFTVALTVASQ